MTEVRHISKLLIVLLSVSVLSLGVSATELQNIESINPQGTQAIGIFGDLDMQNNNIENFFAGQCDSGEVVVQVYDHGGYQCMDVSNEVAGDYVNIEGDAMAGTLDMSLDGNDAIIGISNLGGTDIVGSDNIESSAVTSNELNETDTYSLDWSNLAIAQSDVSSADVGLGNVRNVDLSNTAGAYLNYDTGAEDFNVNSGSMTWGDLGIQRSDVNAGDVGTAGGITSSNGDIQLAANDLDSSGNIDDFSGADDLDTSGTLTRDSFSLSDDGFIQATGTSLGGTGSVELDVGSTDSRYVQRSGDSMNDRLTINHGVEPLRVGRSSGENSIAGTGQSWVGYGGGTNGVLIGYYNSDEIRIGDGTSQVQVRGDLDMDAYSGGFRLPVGTDAW